MVNLVPQCELLQLTDCLTPGLLDFEFDNSSIHSSPFDHFCKLTECFLFFSLSFQFVPINFVIHHCLYQLTHHCTVQQSSDEWHPGMGTGLLATKIGFILFIKIYQCIKRREFPWTGGVPTILSPDKTGRDFRGKSLGGVFRDILTTPELLIVARLLQSTWIVTWGDSVFKNLFPFLTRDRTGTTTGCCPSLILVDLCLLWIKKARVKDKTYIWVSVWWKTKNEILLKTIFCCLLWIEKARVKEKT
jgi:hypothetical protein